VRKQMRWCLRFARRVLEPCDAPHRAPPPDVPACDSPGAVLAAGRRDATRGWAPRVISPPSAFSGGRNLVRARWARSGRARGGMVGTRTRKTRCLDRPARGHLLCFRGGDGFHARRGTGVLSLAWRGRQRRKSRLLLLRLWRHCRHVHRRSAVVSEARRLFRRVTPCARRHDAE
jgi:hypothetical protein